MIFVIMQNNYFSPMESDAAGRLLQKIQTDQLYPRIYDSDNRFSP